jgi:hypothetical protein
MPTDLGFVGIGGNCGHSAVPFTGQHLVLAIAFLIFSSHGLTNRLDVQVLYVERVVFDKLSARFDVFAHQCREDGFALGDVF